MKETLLEILEVMGDGEIALASAAAMKVMLDALISQGFSRAEAMQLLVAHGMGAKVNQ